MSSDGIAISVQNLTKTYRLFDHPGDRIRQFISLGLKRYHREFTALKDVSFDIKQGETVGIVGRNGSGKSTLLQLICGILKPTAGSVTVNGRVSALLELGAGFHPEFTGRENVYFQGMLMGFTRAEMDQRFDDIAAFADIGEFIDQPVRTYSSGMFVRLAFAVAISIEPDILVVDEALAVGDFAFRNKCYARIRQMKERGATLLFVSHDLETVKTLCSRALYLSGGRLLADSAAGEICGRYVNDHLARGTPAASPRSRTEPARSTPGQGKLAEILEVMLEPDSAQTVVMFGEEIRLRVRYTAHADLENLTVAFHVRDDRQLDILGTNTRIEECDIGRIHAGEMRTTEFRFRNCLCSGEYAVSVGLATDFEGMRVFPDWWDEAAVFCSSAGQRWSLVGPFVQVTHR